MEPRPQHRWLQQRLGRRRRGGGIVPGAGRTTAVARSGAPASNWAKPSPRLGPRAGESSSPLGSRVSWSTWATLTWRRRRRHRRGGRGPEPRVGSGNRTPRASAMEGAAKLLEGLGHAVESAEPASIAGASGDIRRARRRPLRLWPSPSGERRRERNNLYLMERGRSLPASDRALSTTSRHHPLVRALLRGLRHLAETRNPAPARAPVPGGFQGLLRPALDLQHGAIHRPAISEPSTGPATVCPSHPAGRASGRRGRAAETVSQLEQAQP